MSSALGALSGRRASELRPDRRSAVGRTDERTGGHWVAFFFFSSKRKRATEAKRDQTEETAEGKTGRSKCTELVYIENPSAFARSLARSFVRPPARSAVGRSVPFGNRGLMHSHGEPALGSLFLR